MKKLLAVLATLLMIVTFTVPVFAAPAAVEAEVVVVECHDDDCDSEHDGVGIAPLWEPCGTIGAGGPHGGSTVRYEVRELQTGRLLGYNYYCYYCRGFLYYKTV